MKKGLLFATALASLSIVGNAQTRMTLHEEFTGENCPPCASTNPGFWSLCDAGSNPSKLIHISYMEPIPSSGWYYMRTQALSDNRATYYDVPFAPYGRYDGHVPDPSASDPGHPYYFSQTDIDAEAALPSQFNMTVTNSWNATYDQVNITVTVTCVAPYSGTLFLRTALVETNDFATSPGTNGETHFANVVQAMYPDANGTSMTGTWAVGDTHTYTITGAVPSFVDISKSPYVVAWIQDDATSANKYIAQAAKGSALPGLTNDAGSTATTGPTGLLCATGTYNAAHSITLTNTGSATLTSATIYYNVDGGAWSNYAWTGSLATGATTTVTMPAIAVPITSTGTHVIIDSIGMANGSADYNVANNVTGTSFFVENGAGVAMPFTADFEANQGQYYSLDLNANGEKWFIVNDGTGAPLGHGGSTYAAYHDCYQFTSGEQNILTMPVVTTTAPSAIDFWVSYCQYDNTTNDQLEVVYSTNCGSSWTSMWSMAGAALATAPIDTNFWVATASSYVMHSVDLSTLPAGAMIGFRATSAYGNNIFLDDINIRSGAVAAGVNQVTAATLGASIFPNPTKDEATLTFNLDGSKSVQVEVVDQLGRTISQIANETMSSGVHTFTINTSAFAAGVYNVVMHTEDGTFTQRLSVVK